MFKNLYKLNFDKNERQELRRKKLLHQQKIKRLKQQDEQRHSEEETHRNEQKRSFYHKNHNRTNLENIHLQHSEWLKEKPENFDDWLLVPCPKGQRCIVVSTKGETKMFSKNKRYRMTLSSLLPGGGFNGSNSDSCILDCIYSKDIDTFYVLDAIHLSIPLMDCDTEFRFFWLKSKFNEINDLEEKYSSNLKRFELLDYYDMANEERVAMALQRYPIWLNNQPELDGFLFYHKESHYVCGTTPLVCWLFPFMLPDILQMPVSRFYELPCNYSKQNPWQYMDEFDQQMSIKQLRRSKKKEQIILNESCLELVETSMEEEQEIVGGISVDQDNTPQNFIISEIF